MECRVDFECPIINVDSESLASGMNKKRELSRVELGCAIMTVDIESKVGGIQKGTEWSQVQQQ